MRLNCSRQLQLDRVTVQDEEAAWTCESPFADLSRKRGGAGPSEAGGAGGEGAELSELRGAEESAAAAADAELGGGELLVTIPVGPVADRVAALKAVKLSLDFTLERPTAGLRFVVPKLGVTSEEGTEGMETEEEVVDGGGQHMFSYRQLAGGSSSSAWFPCVDAWSELCLWKIELTVAEGLVAVASGELQQTVYSQDMREKTFHYLISTPTSPGNVGVAVGPFHIAVHPEMNELTSFCPPGLSALLKHTTSGLDKICEFFEELLASRFPYASYKLVFVDEAPMDEVTSYAGLSLFPLSLLHHSRIIDPVMMVRTTLAHAVASQFFGVFLAPHSWSDAWLVRGLARYITGLYINKVFGNNEYLFHLNRTQNQVLEYEAAWGGIRLAGDSNSPFCTSPLWVEAVSKKAHLVIRLLERKLGLELLFQALTKVVSLGAAAAAAKESVAGWLSGLLLSVKGFLATVSSLTGQELATFVEQWVEGSGHPNFAVHVAFNRKRNLVEMEIEQRPGTKGRCKYVGPLKVVVQELDGAFTHNLQIDGVNSKHELSCHSKTRRQKKRKIPLWTGEEVEMDLSVSDPDSPLLWVRVDPELSLLRRISLTQPDYHWLYQLKYERDVLAQLQALDVLPKFPSAQARQTLLEVIETGWIFFRVRCQATTALADVSNRLSVASSGPPAMLNLWKSHFGSMSNPRIPRMNNFSNFSQYFLMQAIPSGIARLKTGERLEESSPVVIDFLLDLLHFNDNSQNKFSDDHYRASLILALAVAAGTPKLVRTESLEGKETSLFHRLSTQDKAVVQAVALALNAEQLRASFAGVVTAAALQALYTLMKKGHLPLDSSLFWAFYRPPRFQKVRLAAAECILDCALSQRSRPLLHQLLSSLHAEPDPGIRYAVAKLFATRPLVRGSPSPSPDLAPLLRRFADNQTPSDHRLRGLLLHAHAALFRPQPPPPTHKSQPPPIGTAAVTTSVTASASSSLEDGELSIGSAQQLQRH